MPTGSENVRLLGYTGSDRCTVKMTRMTRSGRGATRHSITSFAIVRSVAGNLRSIALAAMRLITSSILVDQVTGRTAGLAPLRMRITEGSSDFVLGGHFHFRP